MVHHSKFRFAGSSSDKSPQKTRHPIEIVEREFVSGFDAMHYDGEKDDIIGIQDALYANMIGWADDSCAMCEVNEKVIENLHYHLDKYRE